MKKLVLFAVACLASVNAFADGESCAITGTNDGSTVMVTSSRVDGDDVVVNVSNDSRTESANVRVVVEFTYTSGNKTATSSGSGYAGVNPQSSAVIKIAKPAGYIGYTIKNISGNKCQ
ncbi:MAG: hypothetical protein K2M94_04595 [Paramuribaculum sp.]|nr:hypothetical protein [Paramuribaculum sp.]